MLKLTTLNERKFTMLNVSMTKITHIIYVSTKHKNKLEYNVKFSIGKLLGVRYFSKITLFSLTIQTHRTF